MVLIISMEPNFSRRNVRDPNTYRITRCDPLTKLFCLDSLLCFMKPQQIRIFYRLMTSDWSLRDSFSDNFKCLVLFTKITRQTIEYTNQYFSKLQYSKEEHHLTFLEWHDWLLPWRDRAILYITPTFSVWGKAFFWCWHTCQLSKFINMPRKWLNLVNYSCYISGDIIFALQKRNFRPFVKTAYQLYFGM